MTSTAPAAKRKYWGWGWEGRRASAEKVAFAEASLSALLGQAMPARAVTPLDPSRLAPPRFTVPSGLSGSVDPIDRASHAMGKSTRDIARAIRGEFPSLPDVVARPESEEEVSRWLDFAGSRRIAVIPYGGGSSVCGGVEPAFRDRFAGAISLDMGKLSGVVEVDATSRAARILAGTLGPDLEAGLKPHGLTLRHYPQSFEFSTLGGWIATRAGGHYATLATHIDELVESIRMITPRGVLETPRLPGSGAGPSPDRMLIGSEGAFGVITEAWMRVVPRPTHRAAATVRFGGFDEGMLALRALSQSGLYPTNARLIDPAEAMISGSGSGDAALLFLAFESADHPLDAWIKRAVELSRDHGGNIPDAKIRLSSDTDGRDGTADAYRASFFEAPYLRDEIILRGAFVETYETAVTWSGFDALDAAVRAAIQRVVPDRCVIGTRITHVYPDGCAPYYTVVCAARDDHESQWFELKREITQAIVSAKGTSTHHHAVGRDVMPFYEQERPRLFADALRAVKESLDPQGIMNPGVLLR